MNKSIKKVQGATRVGAALIILSLCFVQNADAARVTAGLAQPATKTAFGGGKFFTGAGAVGANENSVARYQINAAGNLDQVGLAPDVGVKVNGGAVAGPLHNKAISALAATSDGSAVAAVDAAAPAKIHLITNTNDGKTVVNTPVEIKDAAAVAANALAVPALAVTSSEIHISGGAGAEVKKKLIFSVASPAASVHSKNAGIHVLSVEADSLQAKQNDNLTVNAANKPLKISEAVFDIANADTSLENPTNICFHWNNYLERLYLGLDNVKVANVNNSGALSLGMLSVDPTAGGDTGAINFVPVAVAAGLTRADDHLGIGFLQNAAPPVAVVAPKIYNIVSTRTSTNKDLIIFNGSGRAGNDSQTPVYALPLVSTDGPDKGKIGYLDGANPYQALQAGHELTNLGLSPSAFVGSNPLLLSSDSKAAISHLAAYGDSVYVSMAGDRVIGGAGGLPVHTEEAGIFKSTALFDEHGNVRSWTPWTRAVPPVHNNNGVLNAYKAYGFGVDEAQGALWFVTDDAAHAQKRVALSEWTDSAATAHADDPMKGLSPVLAGLGATSISTVAHFDESTIGFKRVGAGAAADKNYQFIALTALADNTNQKLVLAQTGARSAAEAGDANAFGPVQDFTPANRVVNLSDAKYYANGASGSVVAALGSIDAIELARSTVADKGWLFVGGEKGIAVMRKSDGGEKGKGFNSFVGLENLNPAAGEFPGDGGANEFKFAQIVSYLTNAGEVSVTDELKNVRKVVSDGTYIYALTPSKLIRIAMGIESFKEGKIQKVAGAAGGTVGHEYYQVLADLNDIAPKKADLVAGGFGAPINDISAASDEFFDLLLLDKTALGAADADAGPAGAAKKIALATTRGLFVNEADMRGEGVAAANGKQWKLVTDAFSTVLKMDFVSSVRGGRFAAGGVKDGNLYVTALDANKESVCVYRLDVQGGAAPKLVDNTAATGSSYLYKLGTIDEALRGDLSFDMPADLVGRNDIYNPGGQLLESVQLEPTSAQYAEAIDKKGAQPVDFKNVFYTNPLPISGVPVQDSASGAVYIPGEFGLLVRE